MTTQTSHRQLSVGTALLPVLTMLVLFVAGVSFLELTPELLIVVLMSSAAVAGIVAVRRGATWDDIQRSTGEKIAGVLPALLILLVIGMLIATWVASGTIPFLVYWGVRLVDPRYLVLTAFLATALMSSFTGTSWGSAGTIGVALMGTAVALEAPLPLVAGAIVSGAYFGDKMSPLSDSTIIASMSANVDLYIHIRHLLYTAVPSFAVSLVVYTIAMQSLPASGDVLPASATTLLRDLDTAYSLGWAALLPPIVVISCIIKRVPAAIAITLSSVTAAIVAVAVQDFSIQHVVTAAVAGFRLPMFASAGVDPAGMSENFRTLVERGGLYSMANTLVLVITAFVLAAGMDVSGSLNLLIERILGMVRSIFGLIAATMTAGATMIALTSHGGVTMLVIGALFQNAYRDRNLAPQNLSRTLEDSITITEPLMPWTVSAVFMATTLGVPTLQYAPWAVFCYGGPFFSLLIAWLYRRTGFGLREIAEASGSSAAAAQLR